MKAKFTFLLFFIFSFSTYVFSQNGIIGTGFGDNNWSSTNCFAGSAGDSRIYTASANSTGNSYFRLVTCWSGDWSHWGPQNGVGDLQVTAGSEFTSINEDNANHAFYISANSSYSYVFKTKEGGNPPSDVGLIVFEVQGGDVRTISSVSQSPTAANVFPGQDITVTSEISGSFNSGQGIYLRYSNDNWSTSTIAEMSGSGTTYTGTIPASVNIASASIKYYIFTSGNGLTIPTDKADWYTINLDNNSGSNYSYSVATNWATNQGGPWTDADSWTATLAPTLTQDANMTINHDITASSITVQSGKTLTISKGQSLTLSDDLTNNGTINLNSDKDNYSSLIVQGTSTGNITYKRHVADVGGNDEWDYIGSPVAGQDLQTLITNNSSTLATNGSSVAIAPFDNAASGGDADTSNFYSYYNTTGNSGTTITSGQGFLMATTDGSTTSTVNFTGTINTSDSGVTFAIDDETSSNTNYGKFNLVANPYPSYLAFNAAAVSASSATASFLSVNGNATILHNSFAGLWGYDGDGSFTEYNASSSGAIYIAPGQGFFVAADANANLSFTEAMQTTTGGDDFIDDSDILNDTYEVLLRLYHGEEMIEDARLYFEEGLSLGLDVSYDMGDFNHNSPLMTRLVEEDEGYGMAINAMSTDHMDDVVIPLVINQDAGEEFRVNLHTSTIGEVNIYLEDTELSTLTLLNEQDFVLTPTSNLSDVGRFYIHLTADTLSNEEVNTSLLNAYKKVDTNYITIEGLATQSTNTQISLYNILGTKVMDTTLDNNTNTQMISTNGLSTGIYVIKLESGQSQLTKKLIIK